MIHSRTPAVRICAAAVLTAVPAATAQINIGGISFIDRGNTGEIVLGHIRGGHAVLDFDRDGWQDLVIGEDAGQHNRLFRNIADAENPGGRTFVDVTAGSGLDDLIGLNSSAISTLAVDYDNDGWTDVYFAGNGSIGGQSGSNLLYRNNGDGTFSNVSVSSGIFSTQIFARAAAWLDFDLDGHTDLFVTGAPNGPQQTQLLRNNGDGTFSDASSRLPTLALFNVNYANLATDFDQDGWTDIVTLIISNPGVLLRNVSDGAGGRMFVNVGGAVGFANLGPAPMGIAGGDYDNDGDVDLAISDAVTGTYYRNNGGTFTKFFTPQGIFGWGIAWNDADNDGDLDLYTAGSYAQGANYDRLFRNLGNGTFDDVSPALNGPLAASQHSVQIDFNNDGRRDQVTINPGTAGQTISIYENLSNTGNHWLTIALHGDGARVSRGAAGALVRVTAGGVTQLRELNNGSSTSSTEDQRLHFGLGSATQVQQIEVLWPRTGTTRARTDLYAGPFAVDQFLTLVPRLAGDLNDDGCVDQADLAALLADYQSGDGGDVDGDGDTDQADLAALLSVYGECS